MWRRSWEACEPTCVPELESDLLGPELDTNNRRCDGSYTGWKVEFTPFALVRSSTDAEFLPKPIQAILQPCKITISLGGILSPGKLFIEQGAALQLLRVLRELRHSPEPGGEGR